jgi:hypothetical protein
VTLVETAPLQRRYTVPEDQLGGPLGKLSWKEKEGGMIWAGYELDIQASPFKLVLNKDGESVVEFNDGGLLNYEHYRSKPVEEIKSVKEIKKVVDTPDDGEDGEEKVKDVEIEEEEAIEDVELKKRDMKVTLGEWGEDFKGSHDSKPFGIALYLLLYLLHPIIKQNTYYSTLILDL